MKGGCPPHAAARQGYAIDKQFVADTIESLLSSRDKLLASQIFPNPRARSTRAPRVGV